MKHLVASSLIVLAMVSVARAHDFVLKVINNTDHSISADCNGTRSHAIAIGDYHTFDLAGSGSAGTRVHCHAYNEHGNEVGETNVSLTSDQPFAEWRVELDRHHDTP